jgi:hypothetical protein
MYVSSGSACTEKNSQTPMDPRAITAQNNRVARMGNRFVRGNVTLNTLVQTLGGVGIGLNVPGVTELAEAADFRNSPGCDSSILGDGSLYGGRIAHGSQGPGLDEGGAFLPLSMGGNITGSAAVAGSPAAWTPGTDAGPSAAAIAAGGSPAASPSSAISPVGSPSSASGPGGPGGIPWHWNPRGTRARFRCPPELLPMMSVFPIPSVWPSGAPAASPGTVPAPMPGPLAPVAAPPKPAPVSSTLPPGGYPTTGNVCLDMALGYVLQNQVDPRQGLTCAEAGYQGNKDGPLLTQAFIQWRAANFNNLAKVPYQANPPAVTQQQLVQYGLAGYDDGGSCMCLVLIALATAAGVWWAYSESKGQG